MQRAAIPAVADPIDRVDGQLHDDVGGVTALDQVQDRHRRDRIGQVARELRTRLRRVADGGPIDHRSSFAQVGVENVEDEALRIDLRAEAPGRSAAVLETVDD